MRISDWSSDVCSSDLPRGAEASHRRLDGRRVPGRAEIAAEHRAAARQHAALVQTLQQLVQHLRRHRAAAEAAVRRVVADLHRIEPDGRKAEAPQRTLGTDVAEVTEGPAGLERDDGTVHPSAAASVAEVSTTQAREG